MLNTGASPRSSALTADPSCARAPTRRLTSGLTGFTTEMADMVTRFCLVLLLTMQLLASYLMVGELRATKAALEDIKEDLDKFTIFSRPR